MAGLEVLYHLVQAGIGSSQDAVVVLTHWEMIKHGLRCLGSGDQSSSDDRTSELLPAGWNDNQEVYTLRYRADDGSHAHVLKAITVDSSLLFNLMNTTTQQVSELTVVIADHINEDQLHSFDRVYKDPKALSEQVRRHLVSPEERGGGGGGRKKDKKAKTEQEDQRDDHDPLRIPTRHPRAGTHPHWSDPMVPPFAAGGADLDPLGMRGGGGMIVDPLRSGYPRPPSGIPDILPPGAVPPGARFDPFGPVGRHRPGPDPDHLPPPGYDDMYM